MISKELEVEIRLRYYRDHWPVGTISSQLGVHPDTVRRVVGLDKRKITPRTTNSAIEPYKEFMKETLEKFPNIRATRLLDMIKQKGYTGSVYPVRKFKKQIAPGSRKAFLDLTFMPGEQAQVDWGSFGYLLYGSSKRPLHAFVVVLSYSRKIFAKFFHDMKSARVLEGHCDAFEYFQGVPRVVLFDNMKTAVIENLGTAVRFNRDLLDLAAYFRFEPRACNPRSGWEKGRTERAIRYLREGFFEGRSFDSLDQLNKDLQDWLKRVSDHRKWPDDSNITVSEAYSREKLGPLPALPYEAYEERQVRVDKKAYISFDSNKYPVDPKWVGYFLNLRAKHDEFFLYHEQSVVSSFRRQWGKGIKILCNDHQEKIAKVRGIKKHRQERHSLARTLSNGEQLLRLWADHGYNLSSNSRELLGLIDGYGLDEVEAASKLAIENGTPSCCSIRYILTKEKGHKMPKVQINLRKELADIKVEYPSMSDYDNLY